MSTGKVGVIRKGDPVSFLPTAAMMGGLVGERLYQQYQGSDLQRRNQARWKAGKDAVRRTPAAIANAGRTGVRAAGRGAQAVGRGVSQVLGAPGRAVRAIGDELSGTQYQHDNRSPEYQQAARQGWYTPRDDHLNQVGVNNAY